jgi:hypothetical protein
MSHPARRGSERRHKGFGVLKEWQAGFAGIAVTRADVGDLAGNKNGSPTDGAEPALLAAYRESLDLFEQASRQTPAGGMLNQRCDAAGPCE